ncbi:inorganic polyphosphate kinase [Endozoicomonas montiporae]|uniref:NAD kinase n=2 Tax=Endozoicomonas montiporae TaxID=1027273 RepID=A0A081N9Z6_9GAMM|nr:NAD(+) kinase [Endozoicomonas montiporae]AMO57063.1 NAD+ kinase [Endozoicomonas montiporae CL-33]KEQ15269.1 inorganic polyphosphate kinase [Endozoicomonas montiporae]
MEPFKRIGVTGRQGRSHIEKTLQRLTDFLQGQGIDVLLDESIAYLLPGHTFETSARVDMGQSCDLVIVIGGDGSLLGAARDMVPHGVPLLGVNLGRLGFLTDILPDELEPQLDEILRGKNRLVHRFLLDVSVTRDGKVIGEADALNDVVLHPGQSTRIIEFELSIDNQFVYRQRSDGLIIATPTGSTAYALSGGGPIMHPKLDAIVLVPMYPHMLTNRPLVVDGNSEMQLVVHPDNTIHPVISCDGQVEIQLQPGDIISIRKKPELLKLLHPVNHDFYEGCRSKLRWHPHEITVDEE